MKPYISIITLGVSDLDRSVKFYRDGLGLPTTYKPGEGIAFFQLKGTWLALYPNDALAEDAVARYPELGALATRINEKQASFGQAHAAFNEAWVQAKQ